MKKLSIITINYNNKAGLLKTIESVTNQTYKDFEYVIIDGGSTDGSLEVIEQYKEYIDIVVSEPDSGVYHAMNKGIHMSTGEYVNFMNSGDFFYEKETLEKIQGNFSKGVSILYGNSVYFNKNGYKRNETPPEKITFLFFYTQGLNHQATFMRKELFEKYFYYNESSKICADWEFFIYAIFIGNESYLHLGEYICYYDFSGISAAPENLNLYYNERDVVLKKYFSLFIDDYINIDELNSKRIQNVLYIKKFKRAWKLLKGFSNILLLFLPKRKR